MSSSDAAPDTGAVAGEVQNPEVAREPYATTTEPETDAGEGGEKEVPAAKTFTQEELDNIIAKRVAAAEAKAERRALRMAERFIPRQEQQQARPTQPEAEDLARREGESESDFVRRVVKAERSTWEREQQEREGAKQQRSTQEKTAKLYAEAAKLPGFDRETFEDLPLTKEMAKALIDSDVAPKVMLHLTVHPEEAARIAALPEGRQAAALGRLEERLSTQPAPKPSKAPAPFRPAAGSGNTPVHDLVSAGMDDYVAMRKKQGAAWAR